MNFAGELFKRFVGIIFPIFCKKMVVKNIYDHSRIFFVVRTQSLNAFPKYRMTVRIKINSTVKKNSFLNLFRKIFESASFNRISNEIPDHERSEEHTSE